MIDHASISEALSAALAEFEDLERGRTATVQSPKGSYSYNYTDLASVLGYVRPILGRHGLVCTNPVGMIDGIVSVRTRFLFRDGAEDISPEILYPFNGTPQNFGGLVSYLRRYSTLAACGLATEDSDGADQPSTQRSPARRAPAGRSAAPSSTNPDPPSASQFRLLQALFTERGMSDRVEVYGFCSRTLGRQINSTNEVSATEASILIDRLQEPYEEPEPEEEF